MTFELDEVVSVCVLVKGEDVDGCYVEDDSCVVGGVEGGWVGCGFWGRFDACYWSVSANGGNGLRRVEGLDDGHERFVVV